MSSKHLRASILCLAIVLGACTTASSPSASAAPPTVSVAVATLTVTASPEQSPSAAPLASPTPSEGDGGTQPPPASIDPCTLLTTEEASTLMGKKLGAGVSTTVDQDRVCTFKSGLTEVKLFLAPPAPDSATAQKYWDAERAKAPAELAIKDFKLFDRAAYGGGSAGGVSISALFIIKGIYFFDLYCGFPGCTEIASATAASLVGGRLP